MRKENSVLLRNDEEKVRKRVSQALISLEG